MASGVDQLVLFGEPARAHSLFKLVVGGGGDGHAGRGRWTWEEDDGDADSAVVLDAARLRRLSLVNLRLRCLPKAHVPFHGLTYLNLSFNRLAEIAGLQHLVALKVLDISHNKIAELDPVKTLIDLETLRCDCNHLIEKLQPLHGLVKLKHFSAAHNRIAWEEAIFLTPLTALETLDLSDNQPLAQKPRFWEFLAALRPGVKITNGHRAGPPAGAADRDLAATAASSSSSSSATASSSSSSSSAEFLRTPDGRVMLTQARAHFNASETGKALQGTPHPSLSATSTSAVGSDLSRSHTAVRASRGAAAARSRSKVGTPSSMPDDEGAAATTTATGRASDGYTIAQGIASAIEGLPTFGPARGAKAGRSGAGSRERGTRSSSPSSRGGTNGAAGLRPPLAPLAPASPSSPTSSTSSPSRGRRQPPHTTPANAQSPLMAGTAASAASTAAAAAVSNALFGAPPGATTVVRFGAPADDADAPIALCLSGAHTGYARWSPGGPLACSMETPGRLLCSYKNGAIAAMTDPATGGASVMDPRGRCVLVVAAGAAKVMSKGNVVATYTLGAPASSSSSSPSPTKKSGNNGATSSNTGTGTSSSNSNGGVHPSWRFDGLHITFDPRTFALSVALATDVYACTFSSVDGCALTSGGGGGGGEHTLRDRLNVGRDLKHRDLSHDEHSSVRTGIASVMGQLDDMMSGLSALHKTAPGPGQKKKR